jgi:hypothetical protein
MPRRCGPGDGGDPALFAGQAKGRIDRNFARIDDNEDELIKDLGDFAVEREGYPRRSCLYWQRPIPFPLLGFPAWSTHNLPAPHCSLK